MDSLPFPLVERISHFSARTRQTIRGSLGAGKDGTVLLTSRGTAVKFTREASVYRKERDAYQRLREKRVQVVQGFNIPKLVSFHNEISAIEMTVVQPPYLLDFASAHLDIEPEFPDDVLAHNHEKIHEFFGERAVDVFALLNELAERHGVYMLDARPANIQF